MKQVAALALLALAWPAAAVLQDGETESSLRTILRSEAIAYENGEGVARDPVRAARLYCDAARLGDAVAQYNLGWMYANGRGVERSDSTAAFFFHAAAEQGMEQAERMLATVGGPPNYVPECMVEKPAAVVAAAAARPPLRAPTLAELPPRAPAEIVRLVREVSTETRVDPRLALAVIETESNYDSIAVSPKNAKGLMQLIPATAARFGVSNPYDARQNVRGGMNYLRWLLAYYEGDVILAAAAYNAGEGAVDRYRGIPPYAETRAYVAKVLRLAGMAIHPFDATVTAPSPQLPLMSSWRRYLR
jgi:soluble lytic murein transglycosylase-like protein